MFAILTSQAGRQSFYGNVLGRIEFPTQEQADLTALNLRLMGIYDAVAVVSLS